MVRRWFRGSSTLLLRLMLALGVSGGGVGLPGRGRAMGTHNIHADEGKRAPAFTLPSHTGDAYPDVLSGRQPVSCFLYGIFEGVS